MLGALDPAQLVLSIHAVLVSHPCPYTSSFGHFQVSGFFAAQ